MQSYRNLEVLKQIKGKLDIFVIKPRQLVQRYILFCSVTNKGHEFPSVLSFNPFQNTHKGVFLPKIYIMAISNLITTYTIQ